MHFAAYGIAAEYYFFGREEFLHAVVCHADAVHLGGQHPVGESGESVLLLDEAWDAFRSSLSEQGCAGIASHTYRHVGFEFVQDAAGFPKAGKPAEGHLDIVLYVFPVQLTLQSEDGQAHDLESCRRHLFHLHLAFGSNEKNLVLRVELAQFGRYRYGGEDVPSRAAAADDSPYFLILPGHISFHFQNLQGPRDRFAAPAAPAPAPPGAGLHAASSSSPWRICG